MGEEPMNLGKLYVGLKSDIERGIEPQPLNTDTMSDIYSTSVCPETIDESPMAYKPMQEIIDQIGDTVEIIDIIKPIYNFKAKNGR